MLTIYAIGHSEAWLLNGSSLNGLNLNQTSDKFIGQDIGQYVHVILEPSIKVSVFYGT